MTTLPPISQCPRLQNPETSKKVKPDLFDSQLNKHQKSTTDQILNMIYSILTGVLCGALSRRHIKYSKTIGLLIGMLSFMISKKASQFTKA